MNIRLLTTSVFNTFDLVMTMILVSMFGIGIELNPIGVALFSNITVLFIVKIGVVNLLLYVLYKYRHYPISKLGSWIVYIVYGCLTLYHLVGMVLIF